MTLRLIRNLSVATLAVVMTMMIGCTGASTLPTSLTIELPDGTTVEATAGDGVATLANSTWDFFQTTATGQTLPFITISFGEMGNLLAFENSTVAQDIIGTSLRFDGVRREAKMAGLSYEAATFGAETADSTGFTFVGQVALFAIGLKAGDATATAQGTFDPNDPDVMTGTFEFTTVITLLDIPEANTTDMFNFRATRMPAQ